MNQFSFHIGFHDDLLMDFSNKNNISLQAYSPLGGGTLARPGKTTTQETLASIATVHNKSAAQIALRWIVQSKGAMVAKASTTDYQLENKDIFDFSLTSNEMYQLGVQRSPSAEGAAGGKSAAAVCPCTCVTVPIFGVHAGAP